MRGAIRDFIETTTPYRVCDAVADSVSAIQQATESRCDLILLHLREPIPDSVGTASFIRKKLPHIKIVGFSTLPIDLGNWVCPEAGFDVVLAKQDGLSKLVETLKQLMPEPPRE